MEWLCQVGARAGPGVLDRYLENHWLLVRMHQMPDLALDARLPMDAPESRVSVLLEAGADPHCLYAGMSPMQRAYGLEDIDALALLMANHPAVFAIPSTYQSAGLLPKILVAILNVGKSDTFRARVLELQLQHQLPPLPARARARF